MTTSDKSGRQASPAFLMYAADRLADRNFRAMSAHERGILHAMESERWVNRNSPVAIGGCPVFGYKCILGVEYPALAYIFSTRTIIIECSENYLRRIVKSQVVDKKSPCENIRDAATKSFAIAVSISKDLDARIEQAISRAGKIARSRWSSIAWKRYARLVSYRSPAMIARIEVARGLSQCPPE